MEENTALQLFSYEGNKVRTITDERGELWWVATDVCEILGLSNVADAVSRLDDDEKSTIALTDSIHGNPNRTIVNEPGLYTLILGSRKPEAKAFKRWVTHEVLPAIRKTGKYAITQKQFIEAQTLFNTLVNEPQKLPWGLTYPEIADVDSAKRAFYECIDAVHTWLTKSHLTEKQEQKFLDELATLRQSADALHDIVKVDYAINRHIDDVHFKMRAMSDHLTLPSPNK